MDASDDHYLNDPVGEAEHDGVPGLHPLLHVYVGALLLGVLERFLSVMLNEVLVRSWFRLPGSF
jgi:hypothetical protein